MATVLRTGQRDWRLTRDRDGHREYKITFRVVADSPFVGPAEVLQTSGLPVPGDYWIVDFDSDLWATCKEDAEVVPVITNEPNTQWDVTVTFSTKGDDKRCKDQQWDDPLLIPDRVSGSFTRFTEPASFDKDGIQITNSAYERFENNLVEFDASRAAIRISQNRADLEIGLFTPMVDTVNDAPLWGLPERTIKLSNVTWERKYYGQCYLYYERTFEFEVRYNPGSATDFLGFDRFLLDEGSKVLKGHWQARGSGATVDIMADVMNGGFLTAAVLDAPGSGYEPLARVFLYVTGSTGTGGIVSINANFAGQLIAGTEQIVAGGTGYPANAIAVTTSTDIRWTLEHVSPGVQADYHNPNHFIRYKDFNGENARLVLDGFGKPAPMPRGGSVGDVTDGDNNNPIKIVTNGKHFLSTGDVVRIAGVQKFTAANAFWHITVVDDITFTLDGSENTKNGDFDPMQSPVPQWSIGPGYILVEKYTESNFLLLGIPTSF